MLRRSWHVNLTGMTVYRRRAHLVVWDADLMVTVSPFDLYWSPRQERTFACITRCDGMGLWLPVADLFGHWEFFTGEVVGLKIVDGYGPDGMPYPKTEQIWESVRCDDRTGKRYYVSDRGRLMPTIPQPMAHT